MVVIMDVDAKPLQKSSKGTIMRNVAEEQFREQIEAAYKGDDTGDKESVSNSSLSDNDIIQAMRDIVNGIFGSKQFLAEDSDFFEHGVNSAMCTQIRGRLQRLCGVTLPWSVVYDCGNIST